MKPRTRIITLIVMAVCFLALVGWDIVAAANVVEGDTISELTAGFVQKYMGAGIAVIWSIGLLCGHLFWPQFKEKR